MRISTAFKKDTLAKNTKIIPLVIIEKFLSENEYQYSGFSTNNLQLTSTAGGDIYFKPLLLDLPKLKESIDVTNGNYKISSVSLNFSNIEYNGSRISDLFTNNLLINENVSIHLKSQSCTTITPNGEEVDSDLQDNDCAMLYVGKIRNITHTEDKVNIRLEDLTEKKIHKDLPAEQLSTDDSVPDKYKNKHIPMTYGRLENAPLVGKYKEGNINFISDYKDIYNVIESEFFDEEGWQGSTFINGAIKTYDDTYISLLKYTQKQFIENPYLDEDEEEVNDEYVNLENNNQQYYRNSDNSISLNMGGLWSVDRIQGLYKKNPSVVSFISYQDEVAQAEGEGDIEFINEDNYHNIVDDDLQTSTDVVDQYTYFSFMTSGNFDSSPRHCHRMSWETSPPSSKFNKLIRATINGYRMPVRGDANLPSGYGLWQSNRDMLFVTDLPIVLNNIYSSLAINMWNSNNFSGSVPTTDIVTMNAYSDINSLFTFSANHGNNEDTSTSDFVSTELINNGVGLTWNEFSDIKFKTQFSTISGDSSGDIDFVPILRFHEGRNSYTYSKSPDNFYCIDFLCVGYFPNFTSGFPNFYHTHIDANIKEVDFTTIVEYDDAADKDYFGDIKGRIDNELLYYNHGLGGEYGFQENTDYLENPIDILRHILKSELGITKFNEEEFETAWHEHRYWKLAFSVNERINSKKLIEDISKSTFSFPRLKNNGEFGFVTIKKQYDENDYNNAVLIDENDVIKYNYKLTPSTEIISKLDIEYGYDYGSGDHLKNYNSGDFPYCDMELEFNQPALKFNGIENSEDNKVIFETDYIQDEFTAGQLRGKKYLNEKLSHLVMDIELPLSYSEIEVGTLIKFPKDKLINGMKAYGMDYTNPIAHGGLVRLPLFLITEVQRGLSSISISCYHLHWLMFHNYEFNNPYQGLQNNQFWNQDNFPNINWEDPIYDEIDTGDEDYNPFAPFTAVNFLQFPIGYNSEFTISDNTYPSSYVRRFIITDDTIGTSYYNADFPLTFNLNDQFNNLFGIDTFNISSWADLIPILNSDGSGYGNITNGSGNNNVGGFVAMEIRMGSGINKMILSLRNIAGTEFDPDVYNPETTTIPNTIYPSSTELKLGWVLYISDLSWNYHNIFGSGLIPTNLDFPLAPYVYDNISHIHTMILYPYYKPVQDMKLNYSTPLESFIIDDTVGDINLDGEVNIQDVVILANMVNGNIDSTIYADINQDGIVNVIDIIELINIMQGN